MEKAKGPEVTALRAVRASGLLALLVLLALAGPALGHAQFVSASPRPNDILAEPPSLVVVTLSETVEPTSVRIRVTNSTGAAFEANGTRMVASDGRAFQTAVSGVGPCVYTVAWSATSAVDGHYSAGSFAFAVQNPDGSVCGALPSGPTQVAPPVSGVEVVIRFAAFATMAAMVGAVGLAALALDPTLRRLDDQPRERAVGALRLLTLWAAGQAGAFCAFSAAWATYAVLNAPEGPSSSFVGSLAWRSALGGGVAATMALLPRLTRGFEDGRRTRALLFAALAMSAAAVGLTSASSHAAASVAWKPFGALFDFMHLSAATFWAGSLVALVVLRGPLRSSPRLARGVLRRFSRLAFYAVGGVLLGGILLSVVQLGQVAALFASTYGFLVLAKMGLFAPMVALGAHNRFRSLPALRPRNPDAPAATARISRNVQVEMALGLTVLLLAASLTAISPAAPAPTPLPYTIDARSGDVRVQMEVTPDPGPIGVYNFQFQVFNGTTGMPMGSMGNGTLTLRLVNSTLSPQVVLLEGPHGNHYFTDPPQSFGQAGTWRLDVDLTRTGLPDVAATFNIRITSG